AGGLRDRAGQVLLHEGEQGPTGDAAALAEPGKRDLPGLHHLINLAPAEAEAPGSFLDSDKTLVQNLGVHHGPPRIGTGLDGNVGKGCPSGMDRYSVPKTT